MRFLGGAGMECGGGLYPARLARYGGAGLLDRQNGRCTMDYAAAKKLSRMACKEK
jgi:hypothetical protein